MLPVAEVIKFRTLTYKSLFFFFYRKWRALSFPPSFIFPFLVKILPVNVQQFSKNDPEVVSVVSVIVKASLISFSTKLANIHWFVSSPFTNANWVDNVKDLANHATWSVTLTLAHFKRSRPIFLDFNCNADRLRSWYRGTLSYS